MSTIQKLKKRSMLLWKAISVAILKLYYRDGSSEWQFRYDEQQGQQFVRVFVYASLTIKGITTLRPFGLTGDRVEALCLELMVSDTTLNNGRVMVSYHTAPLDGSFSLSDLDSLWNQALDYAINEQLNRIR